MKTVELTRTDREKWERNSSGFAEELAAAEYRGYSAFRDAGPFDVATESGSVAETKSTATTLENGNPGRFRLFKQQHDKLVRKDRRGTGWYIFVLWDLRESGVTARLKRMNPAAVGNLIGGRGGWNRSGHPAGRQHKVPWREVF